MIINLSSRSLDGKKKRSKKKNYIKFEKGAQYFLGEKKIGR